MNLKEVADQVRAWHSADRDTQPPYERREPNSITFYQPHDNTIITVRETGGFGYGAQARNGSDYGVSAFEHTLASIHAVWHSEGDDRNVWFGAAVDGEVGYIWKFPRSGVDHMGHPYKELTADVKTVLDKLDEIRKAEPANQ